jgi:hypothetical protein
LGHHGAADPIHGEVNAHAASYPARGLNPGRVGMQQHRVGAGSLRHGPLGLRPDRSDHLGA